MRIAVSASLAVLLLASATPSAQPNDLDRLMEQVLARRDENWKKLQQYLLDERETFDLTGPGGARLYGFRRDYSWFMQEGIFVRSPVRADGVTLSESARRKAEADWIRHERRREQRRVERAKEAAASAADPSASAAVQPDSPSPSASSAARPDPPAPVASSESAPDLPAPSAALVSAEPAFVSYAYFLRFRFEPNHYALVGRESLDGRAVLRIEYYPSELFREGRTRPNRRVRDRDEEIEDKMNKVSLVTLWVDPEAHQILQYTFDDIDMDFLPGRSIARVDDVRATMRMGQPFPDVWLPKDIEMHFRMALAVGPVDARYRVEYHDYRQADVTYKIR
ncbi:MAG TPA: hypothetical protein VM820_03010 [Vicinamibacterales bacterium]|nr:hypothetical protein [Vicinamibacterales bacterium]